MTPNTMPQPQQRHRSRIFGVILLIVILCLARCHESKSIAMKTNAIDKDKLVKDKSAEEPWRLIEKLQDRIEAKEDELEEAAQVNRGFEHMIQLIGIMGQVDTFLTERTRDLMKKLTALAVAVDGAAAKSKKT